jgi:hypothetical protein
MTMDLVAKGNARKIYFTAVNSFTAAMEVVFCAWLGLHFHERLAGSLAGVSLLVGAAAIAVSAIIAVRANLREGLSNAVMGLVTVFYLTVFFLLMALGEILRPR